MKPQTLNIKISLKDVMEAFADKLNNDLLENESVSLDEGTLYFGIAEALHANPKLMKTLKVALTNYLYEGSCFQDILSDFAYDSTEQKYAPMNLLLDYARENLKDEIEEDNQEEDEEDNPAYLSKEDLGLVH